MEARTLERSGLDEETFHLVRLAALVATDAAPVSYRAHLDGVGLSTDEVLGAFVAIAPVVGGARVLSAACRLARAGLIPPEDRRITPSG
jgi:4-carboxymuconolactone decarboxylase